MRNIARVIFILGACTPAAWADGAPQEAQEENRLRNEIQKREELRRELDRGIRDAVEREDLDQAKRLNHAYKMNHEEVLQLLKRLEEIEEERRERRRARGEVTLHIEALATRIDHALDVGNGKGFEVGVDLHDFFVFSYRRWWTEDDATNKDVTLQAYLLGPHKLIDVVDQKFYLDGRVMAGLMHLHSDDGGPPSDTGPIVAFEATANYLFEPRFRVFGGIGADLFWTDFNQDRTHHAWNQSVKLGISFAF
ncbi:MAG: hypothetical protein HY716_13480 [Planctomycetes bacterium]|nr:hypothetical protein [Planctomycetota bacterium]